MNEPIRATYLESEAHYLEAAANNPRRNRNFWMVACMFAAGILWFIWQTSKDASFGSQRWWLGISTMVSVFGLALFLFSPIVQRWQLRRQLAKVLHDPPTQAWFEFSDEGFISAGHGGQTSFHPWGTIHHALQRREGLMIYLDKNVFYWIPVRAFENQQLYDKIRQRVADKVKDFKPLNQ